MSSDPTARWLTKANVYAAAYEHVFSKFPSKHHVLFALAVAQLETQCGDLLDGNWGGTTSGHLNAEELSVLANAGLSPDNADDIAKAQAIVSRPSAVLERDADSRGWYWIFFFRPATPVIGAEYFVKILVQQRAACAAILDDDNATFDELARAMYLSHYFSGVSKDPETNINAYSDRLQAIEPGIVAALNSWATGEPPFDLNEMLGVQEALRWLALKLNQPSFDPGPLDDVYGSDTKAAVRAFQLFAKIADDGIVGEITKKSIADAVASAL